MLSTDGQLENASEPLLHKDMQRWRLLPIRHPEIWDFYKKAQMSTWTAEEVDLSRDRQDWEHSLTDDERHFIENVLAFFSNADGIVGENIVANFYNEVAVPEARFFYGFQIHIENVHAEMYHLMLDCLVTDKQKKDKLQLAIENVPSIARKAEWALRWMGNDQGQDKPFAQRLVAFACVEGIFFSSSFCAIFWLKKRGLMPGLTFSNELISRDEGLHCEFAVCLHNRLQNKCDTATITSIVCEAMEAEIAYVDDSLKCDLIGINADLMKQYTQFVADRLLVSFGCPKKYCTSNPFDWMELISLQGKTNFFEKRVGDYALRQTYATDDPFTLDSDF